MKSPGKPVQVALNCRDERFRFDPLELRQVAVEHDPMASNQEDRVLDGPGR